VISCANIFKNGESYYSLHTGSYSYDILLSTEVGRQAEEIVAQGAFVPDDIMLKVVSTKLDELRGRVRARQLWSRP
jgi:adenylate kinase family enzyme